MENENNKVHFIHIFLYAMQITQHTPKMKFQKKSIEWKAKGGMRCGNTLETNKNISNKNKKKISSVFSIFSVAHSGWIVKQKTRSPASNGT